MRPTFLRSGLVYVLAAVSLPFVVACWLVATLAKATVDKINICRASLSRCISPRARYSDVQVLIVLPGIAVIVIFAAIVSPSMPWLGPIAISIAWGYGIAQVSAMQEPRAPRFGDLPGKDGLSGETNLQPAEKCLSRVDIPRFRMRGFGDRELVRQHVAALVNDWLCANGWKYRLVGVWLPEPKTVSPFGAIPEWWKVYQIALEDQTGLVEYGWVRFGDGKVEFRFDVEELHQALQIDPNETHTRANVFPPEPLEVGVGADPLWDRSLDG